MDEIGVDLSMTKYYVLFAALFSSVGCMAEIDPSQCEDPKGTFLLHHEELEGDCGRLEDRTARVGGGSKDCTTLHYFTSNEGCSFVRKIVCSRDIEMTFVCDVLSSDGSEFQCEYTRYDGDRECVYKVTGIEQ